MDIPLLAQGAKTKAFDGGYGFVLAEAGGMTIALEDRRDFAEQRRLRLLELTSQHRLSCRDVGEMLDRHPVTVARWRSDNETTITDHALALLELILRLRMAA